MRGYNKSFLKDPISFSNKYALNNVAWFMGNQTDSMSRLRNVMLNESKMGNFDLQINICPNEVILAPVGNLFSGDPTISAYWCPFVQGNILPGFVDVPRSNPQHMFIFTAAMNGCALVTTESPLGSDKIRIYHHQHPGRESIDGFIKEQGGKIISSVTFSDYGVEEQQPAPNAFNFLYHKDNEWLYVIQPQLLDMLSHKVTLNPKLTPKVMAV